MSPKRKQAPKDEGPKGWLNRAYRYGEAHVATVALVALGFGIVLSGFAFYSFFHEREIEHRVAKIESPCLKSAEEPTRKNKRLCRESFEKAIGTITHPEACAVERKAGTLKALRELAHSLDVNFKEPCKGARLTQERERGKERAATKHRAQSGGEAAPGGDASTGPSPHSPSGPSPGGSNEGPTGSPSQPHGPSAPPHQPGGGPSGGGHESGGGNESTPPPAAAPTSPPSSSPPSSSTTPERVTEVVHEAEPPPSEPPAETAAAPIREVVGGVVETLKPTVEETGHTVTGTVETVTGTTCELAKLLCP